MPPSLSLHKLSNTILTRTQKSALFLEIYFNPIYKWKIGDRFFQCSLNAYWSLCGCQIQFWFSSSRRWRCIGNLQWSTLHPLQNALFPRWRFFRTSCLSFVLGSWIYFNFSSIMLCSRLKEPRILYVGRVWDNHPTDMPRATENLSQTISPIDAGRTYDPCQAIWHLFQHAWCRSHDEGPVVKRVAVLKKWTPTISISYPICFLYSAEIEMTCICKVEIFS